MSPGPQPIMDGPMIKMFKREGPINFIYTRAQIGVVAALEVKQ